MLEQVSSLRRIVRTPAHWDGIVRLAAAHGASLPAQADSKALNDFLMKQKAADPDHFADLSLAVIKLIGPGQYVLERPGDPEAGHFGLAVQDYTHSTAPNRRFADVVTQRIVKAWLDKKPGPYSDEELTGIATNCTQRRRCGAKSRTRDDEASVQRWRCAIASEKLGMPGYRHDSKGDVRFVPAAAV